MSGLRAWRLHSDGACRGNPGPAAYGFVIYDGEGKAVAVGHGALGPMTNNQAEYLALDHALVELANHQPERVEICCDSQLVVRQLTGAYRVRQPALRRLWRQVSERIDGLRQSGIEIALQHVPREDNAEADRLANLSLDGD